MNATLKEGRCNIMIGAPQGYDLVRTTKPYYRSTYVFVYRKDKGFQIKSLDDPMLKKLRIGVHLLGEDYNNPPPVYALSKTRALSATWSASRPSTPRRTHRAGLSMPWPADKIDVAIVWGPAAATLSNISRSRWRWCRSRPRKGDLPFAFDISMGVKPGDDELRAETGEGAG